MSVSDGLRATDWYTRPVFFVRDAEASLEFYQCKLGCTLDWSHQENGRAFVCQVSRPGFELILAQDAAKAGGGRVFISLDEAQTQALQANLSAKDLEAKEGWWGMPVIEILDLDNNELLFSPPNTTSAA